MKLNERVAIIEGKIFKEQSEKLRWVWVYENVWLW